MGDNNMACKANKKLLQSILDHPPPIQEDYTLGFVAPMYSLFSYLIMKVFLS